MIIPWFSWPHYDASTPALPPHLPLGFGILLKARIPFSPFEQFCLSRAIYPSGLYCYNSWICFFNCCWCVSVVHCCDAKVAPYAAKRKSSNLPPLRLWHDPVILFPEQFLNFWHKLPAAHFLSTSPQFLTPLFASWGQMSTDRDKWNLNIAMNIVLIPEFLILAVCEHCEHSCWI